MSIRNALLLHRSRRDANAARSVASKAIAQQALEPRILLDAAGYSTLVEASGDVANDDNLDAAVQQLGPARPADWNQTDENKMDIRVE